DRRVIRLEGVLGVVVEQVAADRQVEALLLLPLEIEIAPVALRVVGQEGPRQAVSDLVPGPMVVRVGGLRLAADRAREGGGAEDLEELHGWGDGVRLGWPRGSIRPGDAG